MTRSNSRLSWLLLLCPAFYACAIAVGFPGAEEQRGKEIYYRGTASGKEIFALLDGGQTRVNASVIPCAGCHGADGRGKNEGGVAAPDITWAALTKPYSVPRPDGRSRPPYTESSVKRAIAMGMDSGGQPLLPVMPRFQLSYQDANDLVVFLKQLGQVADPGVFDSSIRIGIVLPQPERLPALHDAIRKSLSTYFDDINNAGGIYSRRIELKFFDLQASGTESAVHLRAWLERESVFALTGSFLARDESSLAPILNETATPLICAFVLDPDVDSPLDPYVFYLDAGLRGEVEELIDFAQKQMPGGTRVTIAAPNYDITRKLGDYIKTSLSGTGRSISTISPDVDGCRSAAANSSPQIIFWLSPQLSVATLRECSDVVGKQARFLLPGSFAGPELLNLPDSMNYRVFVTMPDSNSNNENVANATYKAANGQPWFNQDSGERPALASARLLMWALQRAGRDLSRQKLLEALEGVYNLDLGFGFSVTYGPNRRIGGSANKIYVIDLRSHTLEPVNSDLAVRPN